MLPPRLYSSALSESFKKEMPSTNTSEADLERFTPRIESHVEFPPLRSHAPSPLTACITPSTPSIVPRKPNEAGLSTTSLAPLARACEDNYTFSATTNDVAQGVAPDHESDINTAKKKPEPPIMPQVAWYPPLTFSQHTAYPTPWQGYGYPAPAPAPMLATTSCFGYYDPAFPPWAPWNLPPFANSPPAPYGFGPQMPPTPQTNYALPYHYPPPSLPIPVPPSQVMGPCTIPSSSRSMRKTRSQGRHSACPSEERRRSSVSLSLSTKKLTPAAGSRRPSRGSDVLTPSATSWSSSAPMLSHTMSKAKLRLRTSKISTTPTRAAVPKFKGPKSQKPITGPNQDVSLIASTGSNDVSDRWCICNRLEEPETAKEETSSSNVSWSQSKQWSSDEKKEIQAFQKMQLNLRFMGADKSPFVPRSVAELAALRATIAESKKEMFAREVAKRLRLLKKVADTDESVISPSHSPQLYTGKRFQDCLSALFAVTSCFCEGASLLQPRAEKWPSIIELKDAKLGFPIPHLLKSECTYVDSTDCKIDAADFYNIRPVDDGFGSDIKNIDQAVLEQVPDFVRELVQYIEFDYYV